ncbi:glycosyltransferase [Sulfitobacter sp. HNIBRBA3233]|uniref:glycosyltransferase family 2 protein n=1 Tax=Sulfitobacter marinivivus TaxID=3158558 RepID=UPI0032DF6118
MSDPTVSVIVVSRHRPQALQRCLTGLSQVQYPAFEIVVVADPAGIDAVDAMAGMEMVKLVPYNVANISAARNLGIAQAAGDIVAFIDDDAVPEPTWLRHLVAPAAHRDVAAVGGFVRGRNGISYQWRARTLDTFGNPHPVELDPYQATVLMPPKGRAIKTEGTNMAVRRDVIVALGGFDSAFRFFLDETDLNMRLARAGHATAIAPLAQVHHGFAASARRREDRVPRDLTEIGASWAVFQRKYIPPAERASHWAEITSGERRRLLRHMVSGRLMPGEVRSLMRGLRDGYAEGQTRSFGASTVPRHSVLPFRPFPARARNARFTAVRGLRGKAAIADAAARVSVGETIETVLVLSPSAFFHRSWMTPEGVWVQRGGLFGKAERSEPLFRLNSFRGRVRREKQRIARVRGIDV